MVRMATDRALLSRGLESLGLDLPETAVNRLLAYRDLLVKWNRAYNLTAVRDPREMIGRHLIDSLAALAYLPEGRLLDMGAGAGLPGIPFAIARPDRAITLLDGNGKKTRFCRQVCAELGLENVQVHQNRAEEVTADALGGAFDGICCRAFAALDTFWNLARPLLKPDGQALALKAMPETAELRALEDTGAQWRIQPLNFPGGEHRRCLVVIERSGQRESISSHCG